MVKTVSVLSSFQFWNWQKAGLVFTTLAILILGMAAFFIRVSQSETSKQTIAEKQPEPVSSENRSESVSPQHPELPKKEFPSRKIASLKKAKSEIDPSISVNSAHKIKPSPPGIQNEPEAPFTTLVFAGDFEADEERQII
jgi:type IV secretory pathway VirB10-like protein